MLRNLIFAELVAYAIFLMIALAAHWALLYRQYFASVARYVPFTILEFIALAAVQVALIIVVVIRALGEDVEVDEIIRNGEHERAEFKSTFRWDLQRGQVNREMERSVMKTIAAFLNSQGGNLIIGVDDQRRVQGLQPDLASLNKHDHDGFENHFNNVFVSMIGPEFRRFVKLTFHDLVGKSICLVQVNRAHAPAYLRHDRGEDFFIRTGNATTALKVSEVAAYVTSWRN